MIFLFLSFKSLKACKHLLLKARHEFEMVDSQNGRLSCMAPSATSLLVVASFLYWLKLAIKCIGGHIQRETMWKKRKKKHHHHTTVSGWEQFLWSSALFFLGGYSLANWCEGTQSFKRLRKIIGQKDVWSYCIILWHFSLRLNSCTVLSKRETLSLSLTSHFALSYILKFLLQLVSAVCLLSAHFKLIEGQM